MNKASMVVRLLCLIFGALLISWALIDDYIIGGGPGFGAAQLLVLAVGVVLALFSLAPYKISAGVLTAFISGAVTLFVAELMLRSVLAPQYYTPFQADSRYHYKLVPGASRQYQHLPINGGDTVVYHVNSDGFRGGELSKEKDKKRIVVYGDSFIQAEFSSFDNTFAHQLALQLSEQLGETVEVVNAGVAGYGPDQILKKMQDELPILQADLVILSIFAGNDFGDLVRNKMYRVADDAVVENAAYQLSEEFQRNIALSHQESIIKKILQQAAGRILGGSHIEELATMSPNERVELYRQQHSDEYKDYVVNQNNVVWELLSDPYSADISLTPTSDSAAYKVKLMDAILGQIKATVAGNQTRIVGLIVPHPMDLLDGNHDSGAVDRSVYPDYQPSRLTDTLASLMGKHQFPYVNLYPSFKQQDPANLYFKGGDDHWNDLGQRLAGTIVSDYLVANQLIQD